MSFSFGFEETLYSREVSGTEVNRFLSISSGKPLIDILFGYRVSSYSLSDDDSASSVGIGTCVCVVMMLVSITGITKLSSSFSSSVNSSFYSLIRPVITLSNFESTVYETSSIF